jgi:hypothetical protein
MKGIITLCGSTRFKNEFNEVSMELTIADYAVLSVGAFLHSDPELKDRITEKIKRQLDRLHFEKISISQAIVVINKDYYVGESTRNEITYANNLGKQIYWYQNNSYSPGILTKEHPSAAVITNEGYYESRNWRDLLE